MSDEFKFVQYVFVPKSSKMSPGKIASQVAHATFLALDKTEEITIKLWKYNGMPVIVFQVKDQIELHNVCKYLEQENIIFASYNDEVYTEVPPCTMTAVATGVLEREKHMWRFDQFVLYKDTKWYDFFMWV